MLKTNSMLVLGLLLISCGAPTATFEGIDGGGTGLQPGIIRFDSEPIVITVPLEAVAGRPIVVEVSTYGGGCMSKGTTETTVTELTAVVAPFDEVWIPDSGTICPANLGKFKHTANVTFERAGEAFVVLRGREWPGNESFEREFRVAVQ